MEEWTLTEVIDSKHLRNKDRIRKKKLLRGEKSYINTLKAALFVF